MSIDSKGPGGLSREGLRIVDANLNRAGEGLRVLEEFARLALNEVAITQLLKNLRHRLLELDIEFQQKLIGARDSEGDVGSAMNVPEETKGRDAVALLIANSKRVQESLRVLEEIARDPGSNLDSETYRRARFEVYTLEKGLVSRLSRQEKIARLPGLYVIIDTAFLRGRDYHEITKQAIKGGATTIQLRAKDLEPGEFLPVARGLKNICAEMDVLFIVNDSLEIALASDADGLHVGQEDLPVSVVRKLLPVDKVLGCSARTVKEASLAASDGADYIGVGAVYPTSSKEVSAVIGVERVREIRREVDLPIVAIGGINNSNISAVMEAGAVSAAVISAVLGQDDVETAARRLCNTIERTKSGQS